MTEEKMIEKKKIDNGGPAFPRAGYRFSQEEWDEGDAGMSLRDWFAGMAASGRCDDDNPGRTAAWCYQIADALLAERKK